MPNKKRIKAPTPTLQDTATRYGFALAIIKSDKGLTQLFNDAWKALKSGKEWSQPEFTAQLKSKDWYKTRTEQERKYYILSKDPSQKVEFASQIKSNEASISNAAKKVGASLTAQQLTQLAKDNMLNGWNSAQLEEVLINYINYQKDPSGSFESLIGTAGNIEDDLRDFANKMGVSVSDGWILSQTKQSLRTGDTQEASAFAKDFIRARAKEKYAAYASDLDNSTMEDLSYNFRQSMANTLELDSVDFNDKTVQNAMITGDGKGGKMTLSDFERSLRKDPRWTKTNNAKEAGQSVVNDILSSFGLM